MNKFGESKFSVSCEGDGKEERMSNLVQKCENILEEMMKNNTTI